MESAAAAQVVVVEKDARLRVARRLAAEDSRRPTLRALDPQAVGFEHLVYAARERLVVPQ